MKKYIVFAAALLTAAALAGCGDYHPVNQPRSTQTNTSNILTTVTKAETTRPETYSEYISSLKAMNDGILPDESADGISAVTGILPENTLPISAETGVTGIELTTSDRPAQDTAISAETSPQTTSVPPETQPESDTAICETVAPIALDDIPPVPSEAVRRSGE